MDPWSILDSKNLPKWRKNNLPSLISHRTLNMSMIVYLFGHRNPKTRKPNTIFLIKVGRTHVFTEYKSTQLTHTKIYIGIDIVAYITFVWGLYWFGILTKGDRTTAIRRIVRGALVIRIKRVPEWLLVVRVSHSVLAWRQRGNLYPTVRGNVNEDIFSNCTNMDK